MSETSRRLLWAWLASLAAEAALILIASSRSRYECNIGSSTAGCESLDQVLWLLMYFAVPVLAVLIGLVLLFSLRR